MLLLFAITQGFHPPHTALRGFLRLASLETGLVFGVLLSLCGLALLLLASWGWREVSFGELDPR
jgi:hypothetical protein